jgi:hypothetical protein
LWNWSAIFKMFEDYCNELRMDGPTPKRIAPEEANKLSAILDLIATLLYNSEAIRTIISENGHRPLDIFFHLLCCSIPTFLKAKLITAIAAFAKSPKLTLTIWSCLENSQILQTNSSTKPIGMFHQ